MRIPSGATPLHLPPILLLAPILLVPMAAAADPAQPAAEGNARELEALRRFSFHEPNFAAIDPGLFGRGLNAKFQLSLALRAWTAPAGWTAAGARAIDGTLETGLYASFTQTSYWDLHSDSKPFTDSNYRPELAWRHLLPPDMIRARAFALDIGYYHESNGKDGELSRTIDAVAVRPRGEWDLGGDWSLRLEPRLLLPLGAQTDNPDIFDYRGRIDWNVSFRQAEALAISARLRVSDEHRASAELSASYDLSELHRSLGGRVFAQGFIGWSESLATYDQEQRDPRIMVGWAINH